jgi:hypothetical protein
MKMKIVCELQGYDAYEVLAFAFAAREWLGGYFFGAIGMGRKTRTCLACNNYEHLDLPEWAINVD